MPRPPVLARDAQAFCVALNNYKVSTADDFKASRGEFSAEANSTPRANVVGNCWSSAPLAGDVDAFLSPELDAYIREQLATIKEQLKLEILNEVNEKFTEKIDASVRLSQLASQRSGFLSESQDNDGDQTTTKQADALDILAEQLESGIVAEDRFYQWTESIWDLAMLIGLPEMGALGSLFVAFLTCANMVIQVFMCCLINDNFTAVKFAESTVNDMEMWRVFSGHSWDLVDKISFQPIVKRLCEYDTSMPVSSAALATMQTIRVYRPKWSDWQSVDPLLGHLLPWIRHVGMLMCLIALLIWLLNSGEDFKHSAGLFQGLKLMPAGRTQVLHTSDGKQWISISWHRRTYCLFLVLVKFLISVLLSFNGAVYISRQIVMENLLLNAAAMQIVLQMDDLMFSCLAPREGVVLLRSLANMPTGTSRSFFGLNWWPVQYTILLVLAMLLTWTQLLVPQAKTLDDIREVLCGGNINFIAMLDSAGILTAGVPKPVTDEILRGSYVWGAVKKLMFEPEAIHSNISASMSELSTGMTGSFFSLGDVLVRPPTDSADVFNANCVDMDDPRTTVPNSLREIFLQVLQDATGSANKTCKAIKEFCSTDTLEGVRSRQYCPITCGCADPGSSLILSKPNGCPTECSHLAPYTQAMNRPCTQPAYSNNSYLINYVKGLRQLEVFYPMAWQHDVDVIIQSFETLGCGAVQNSPKLQSYAWPDWCEPSTSWYFKSLTYACPVACRCQQDIKHECPYSCWPI